MHLNSVQASPIEYLQWQSIPYLIRARLKVGLTGLKSSRLLGHPNRSARSTICNLTVSRPANHSYAVSCFPSIPYLPKMVSC